MTLARRFLTATTLTFQENFILMHCFENCVINHLFSVAEYDNHPEPELHQVHVEISRASGRDELEKACLKMALAHHVALFKGSNYFVQLGRSLLCNYKLS